MANMKRHFNGARKKAYKARLFSEQGGRCKYCGKRFQVDFLTLDHVKPVSAGGTNRPDNLVLACRPCNEKKANRAADKFVRQLARNRTYA